MTDKSINPADNEPIPIIRFNSMTVPQSGVDGENRLMIREGLVRQSHPVVTDEIVDMDAGEGMRTQNPADLIMSSDDGDIFPSGPTGENPNISPSNDCNPGGRGGGRGRGGGGGGQGGGGRDDDVGDYIDSSLTLDSVGGLKEQINFVRRAVIYPLQNKADFKSWGVKPPKGVLFHGPPGTGKTLLAKCIANEIKKVLGGVKLTFIYHKGCESNSNWFGESEENLRKIFDTATSNAPSVIFFDEIDGLCPDRDKASETSEAYVGVVTALLGLIDSINRGEVFLIGATNRLDAIDVAIRRPGRFDKDLLFHLPDAQSRQTILKIHTKSWYRDQPENELLEEIGNVTVGYSGADIGKLCKDVFSEAKLRCGQVNAADIRITRPDWMKSLGGMQPSQSDVFGSTLMTAKPPLPVTLTLAQNNIRKIVQNLSPLLPNENGQFPFAMNEMRSYLLYEKDLDSEVFLNHVIMNGVLSDPRVSKVPVYYLDLPHLSERMNKGSTPVEAVVDMISQAAESANPCILFVPGINWINTHISRYTQEQTNFVFLNQLRNLAGTNAFVLASVIGNMTNISTKIKEMFSNQAIFSIENPDHEERKSFFGQLFSDLISKERPSPSPAKKKKQAVSSSEQQSSEKFQKHLETTVNLTQNDPCDFLLKLYDTLRKEKIKYASLLEDEDNNNEQVVTGYNLAELEKSFSVILDQYHHNRLQD